MIRAAVNNLQSWKKAGAALGDAWMKAHPTAAQAANPGLTGSGQAQFGPAAAPAAPVVPAWSADPVYQSTLNRLNTNIANTDASATADENALGTDFGIKFDRGADGTLGNFQIDLSNPFSKASALQRAFEQQQKANTGQLASRGQLYSGYLQSKQEDTGFAHQQGEHDLISGFGGLARQILQRRLDARNAAGAEGEAAASDALGRTLQAGPQPGAPPPPAAPQNAAQILSDPSKPWTGRPQKWTAKGLFYQRADGKWIPIK